MSKKNPNDLERLLAGEITTEQYVHRLNERAKRARMIYQDTAKHRRGKSISFEHPRFKP